MAFIQTEEEPQPVDYARAIATCGGYVHRTYGGKLVAQYNREDQMSTSQLTIPYSDDLLLSLKLTPEGFEAEARMLLAIKLYESGRVTTGVAAQIAGMDRVTFIFELAQFGLSPIGVDPDELESDFANA